MIRDKNELKERGLEIDLTGPDGNAFVLLGYATRLAKQLDKNPNEIKAEMMGGDYEHLLEVFEREFGNVVTLYR